MTAEPFSSPMTRRDALRLSAGTLLALGLWPGCATRREARTRNFRFAVVNDTHYMSPECAGWLEGLAGHIRGHQGVEFCLLVGDLVEKGRHDHLAAVRDIFSTLRMPVYAVPGNHDYLSARDRSAYDELFPGRGNYAFEHGGWQFVGLDSTQGVAYEKTRIQAHTLDWVDERRQKLDRARPTIVFTHFPLGERVRYRPLNADDLLDRFRDVNLRAVFNGHFHGATERTWQNAAVTTNRCCALKRSNHDNTTEKGYFICDTSGPEVRRAFIEYKPGAA